MLGGALFTLFILLFESLMADPSGPVSSTMNTSVMLTVALLLPGSVGFYLAHRDAFGRISKVFTGALVAEPDGETVPNVVVVLASTGPVGLAWIVLGYDMLTARDGGITLARQNATPGD